MKDLYKHLEDVIDKFYTLEEKMSYHYETLIELYKLFNYIKVNGLESYKSDNYMKNINESFKKVEIKLFKNSWR